MTIAGVAVVVFASVLMLSLSRGLHVRLDVSGEDENLLLISRKGQNAIFSSIEEEEIVHLWSLPGIASSANGQPLVSPELLHVPFVEVEVGSGRHRAPVNVRGVQPVAYEVHRDLHIQGRAPEGEFEILAGCTAHIKLGVPPETLAVGKTVRFEGRDWTVCGAFTSGGSLVESELWVKEEELQTVLRRRTHSFVVARFNSPAEAVSAAELFRKTGAVERYFKGWPEKAYYREFTEALSWVFWLSVFMVCAITVAGALIGMNTMFTSIQSRMREIATQRVLGFSKFDILAGLLAESLVIALAGGVLGTVAGLLVNDIPIKMSYGAFYLVADLPVAASGVALALFIGVAGALLPAIRGLHLTIIEAIRSE